jgi:hypothetical protein
MPIQSQFGVGGLAATQITFAIKLVLILLGVSLLLVGAHPARSETELCKFGEIKQGNKNNLFLINKTLVCLRKHVNDSLRLGPIGFENNYLKIILDSASISEDKRTLTFSFTMVNKIKQPIHIALHYGHIGANDDKGRVFAIQTFNGIKVCNDTSERCGKELTNFTLLTPESRNMGIASFYTANESSAEYASFSGEFYVRIGAKGEQIADAAIGIHRAALSK